MWFIIGNLALLANIYLHYALDLWATAPPRSEMNVRRFISAIIRSPRRRGRAAAAAR